MEEYVGQLWHRLVTRAAATHHPRAAVILDDVERSVGVLFRALGGTPALRIDKAHANPHGARRTWLQRLAGSHRKITLAWRDADSLRLPERIACFADVDLNRELYFWLAALAAVEVPEQDWLCANQQRTERLLARFPGIIPRYRRLRQAHLAQRPDPAALPAAEAKAERLIRAALQNPGSVGALPRAPRPPRPVYLWLLPAPDEARTDMSSAEAEPQPAGSPTADSGPRRRGERVAEPDGRRGLLAFRLESLFSWSEFLNVDRTTDDSPDRHAKQAADDLDVISVAAGTPPNSRLRFDLDLPATDYDDLPIGEGIKIPEWDYRLGRLRPEHCRVQPLLAAAAPPCELPAHLRQPARKLRQQFRALAPTPVWQRGEPEGCEIDLDAVLQQRAERQSGRVAAENRLYRDFRRSERQLACLLLADLSLSTDAWISDSGRVIDVIRDSLWLFAEALAAVGDTFALYGFSSRRRDPIRFHTLKSFTENYDAAVRGRIQALRPGFYTRLGAAVRYASILLSRQRAAQRLLVLLTDGKPNDLDRYEGRYGVEDTRMAVLEARRLGLEPFCITIDERAGAYMPYLFGGNAYVLIRCPVELPRRLPLLYARLTGRH